MNRPVMVPVRDYFVFIDHVGNIWKLTPEPHYDVSPPLQITLIHRA